MLDEQRGLTAATVFIISPFGLSIRRQWDAGCFATSAGSSLGRGIPRDLPNRVGTPYACGDAAWRRQRSLRSVYESRVEEAGCFASCGWLFPVR